MTSFLSNMSSGERQIVIVVGILGILVGGYFLMTGDQKKGTWRYGVCKTFLERHLRFPETIDILSPSEKEASAKIYYTQMNPYGHQQMQLIECHYQRSANGSPQLSTVSIDRTPIHQDEVDGFNKSIPALLTVEMDLTYPPRMKNTLENLKR